MWQCTPASVYIDSGPLCTVDDTIPSAQLLPLPLTCGNALLRLRAPPCLYVHVPTPAYGRSVSCVRVRLRCAGAVPGSAYGDRRLDAHKSEQEVRVELAQLREVWHADQQELAKLHKVLAVESGQTLEAKAAMEETHREMDRLRRDLHEQLHGMRRELDRKDERIRKLELQLRGAYSGVNRALRSSHVRESRSTSAPDDLSELGPHQNILELHISDAALEEGALGKDPSTFFTFDFFMHDTQATPVVASSRPQFNTLVQVRLAGCSVQRTLSEKRACCPVCAWEVGWFGREGGGAASPAGSLDRRQERRGCLASACACLS